MATKRDMTPSVRVEMDFIHYSFLGTGKERFSGVRKIPYKGGYFEISGLEIPNWHDGDVFLGILKAFNEKRKAGLAYEGEITKERKTTAIQLSTKELCFYAGAQKGGKTKNTIIDSLKRFQKTTVEAKRIDEKGKIIDCQTLHTILYADWTTDKKTGERHFEIAINSAFLDQSKNRGLLLHFRSIQMMSNQIAKGLWAIIQTNKRTKYSLDYLKKQLWIKYEKNMAIFQIKEAANQIIKITSDSVDSKRLIHFYWTNETTDDFLNVVIDKGDKPCKKIKN
ncbi:hypothetical protein [Geobacter sp.]|uniref:hypothetical protein n=1 Tax=Geobacter sp. TaxID=46610 RepID=UPI0027B9D925|nr:hypothetical protein [Geobacter sp.]